MGGRRRCRCGEEPEPDENCQFCYGLPASRHVLIEVPEFPCSDHPFPVFGGTYVLPSDPSSWFRHIYDENYEVIGCRWSWSHHPYYSQLLIEFSVWNTGTIDVVIPWDAGYFGTITLTYRLEYFFSGDPPFPCMDVLETELPLVSVHKNDPLFPPPGCIVGGEVVYVSFLEGWVA